ncbi:MAG TPA: sugar phosphate nucleotidyltransferase [Terracidiphilus sp.]|nr:sugar phosphate nucleotidyltransferase [Terracidiphilus sp.]
MNPTGTHTATPPTLLILAAGMGSRYGGLKQIEPVGPSGEAIIDYSIYDALRAGFGRLVFVIRKEIEQPFRETVGARFEKRIAVNYVFQELDRIPAPFPVPAGRTKPWGTTHAILMAADQIHEPFAAINADDFYGAASYRLLAQHLRPGVEDYAMVGFILRNTLSEFGSVARGICRIDDEDHLESVVEMTAIARDGAAIRNTDAEGRITPLTGDEPVSMNMWGFTSRIFPQLRERFEVFLRLSAADLKRECYIPSTVNELVAAGEARVKVLRTPDAWFGVTYREDHPRVVESIRRLIRAGAYPERLWP